MSGEALANYQITVEKVKGGMEKVYQVADTRLGRDFTKDCSYQRLFRISIQSVVGLYPQSRCYFRLRYGNEHIAPI